MQREHETVKQNLTHKIIAAHLLEGELRPGCQVAVRIDQTLTQDATGTMAYLQFEALGVDRVQTELSVSYVDHNTVQIGFENADDHRYLQTVAARYGIVYSRAGNGICHQVHLERFGRPGKTLLGADSHTPTGGGIGMLAVGVGGLDVAVAMAGGPFYMTYPKVCQVRLAGHLRPWVSAKDVILKMLETLSTKGNVDWVIEYGGPGVVALSVPERATIANMGAEMGVTTSIFPSDEETRRFLAAQGREDQWIELLPDEEADYDRAIDLDLGDIEPMTAYPHSPGNVKPVRDFAGKRIDQVEIGSCTNSSYVDMITVARILKGKRVHPDVSLAIAPGSRQVLQMLAREGALADLIDSGARIMESACGFCIGNSQSPQTDAVSLRTNNRNFEGRSGTASAQVYLVSPATAAAAAITGVFTDPRDLDMSYPEVYMPERFSIDDSMFIASGPDAGVEVYRGPNIGEPPLSDPLPADIAGEITIVVGDKITTDHIMPAGARMKFRSNVPRYARYVFEHVDPTFASRAAENRDRGVHNLIVAGESYGQGSSREHAALCPMYLGVKAVIAKSFERIHVANLINVGIVPLTFGDVADYARIESGDKVSIADIRGRLERGEALALIDQTKGLEIPLAYDLTDRQRAILMAGGMLNYTKPEEPETCLFE